MMRTKKRFRVIGVIVFSATVLLATAAMVAFRNPKQPIVKPAVVSDCAGKTGLDKIICLSDAFKTTLTPDQLAMVQLQYSKANAVRWSNFPQAFSNPNRVGLNFGAMTAPQITAAKALMAAVLSNDSLNEGYDEMEGVLAADDYFGKKTGQGGTFGSNNYYIAFLGTPSTTALWELQFGGHHFAFANTYSGGKITGVTPSCRGVEPMAAVATNSRTYQPIEQERADFAKLISLLTPQEQTSAKLSASFDNILLGPGEDGKFPQTKQGVKVGSLSAAAQKQVIKAIERYVNDLDAPTAKAIMAKYIAELANTYLSYSGSGNMAAENDYIRLDGPNVWIEYSAQPSRDFPGTTHPHSVWRDKTTDYGGN